jgi:peptide/nickel transport system substrate-binding protein
MGAFVLLVLADALLSFNSLKELQGSAKVKSKVVDSYNYIYIAVSPWAVGGDDIKDAKVRQAIKLAIDYQGMIESTVSGNGKLQASPIPNGFQGAKDLAVPKQDLAQATQLMKDAGKEAGFSLDAIYPKVNVYGVDFDVMMQKVQQDLKKIKIDLKLQPVEFPQWSATIKAQGIPMTAVYFAPDHTDSSQYVQYFGMMEGSSWATRAGGGASGKPVINPVEGDLYTKAQASSGDAKTKLYTQIGQAMMDDLVILPMVNPQLVLAYASDVTNMHYSACCNLEVAQLGLG